MARHDDREQAWVAWGKPPMRRQNDLILPRMRTGREPDRPSCPGKGQAGKLGRVSRQGGRGIFQITPAGHGPPGQHSKALRIGFGLRQNQRKAPQQSPRKARRPAPATCRAR